MEKFKVGDRVRIKDNLIADKYYNGVYFNKDMREYMGKEATIVDSYPFILDIDRKFWNWSEEMLEKAEITKAELQSRIDKLENINKKIYSKVTSNRDKIENLKREIMSLKENDKPILDKEEKKYLSAVIKPFKGKVENISKTKNPIQLDSEYIHIDMVKYADNFSLPFFKENTMYKGMKLDKKYTLKELGLDE